LLLELAHVVFLSLIQDCPIFTHSPCFPPRNLLSSIAIVLLGVAVANTRDSDNLVILFRVRSAPQKPYFLNSSKDVSQALCGVITVSVAGNQLPATG
jgi:hypothetical protein